MNERIRLRAMRGIAAVLLGSIASTGVAAEANTAAPCEAGSYAMADGSALDIAAAEPGQLRWRRTDGRSGALKPQGHGRWTSTLGWTDKPDGHRVAIRDCGRDGLRFDAIKGKRIALVQTDTRFEGSGVELAGRLTLPPGEGRVPIVVLVHGAEHTSALERYSLQREFASQGIGVFAYDKRGTGTSGGRYTQDYLTLAVDAIHALHEARRLAGARAGRIGYQGGSQGGWVVPLAARIESVDFAMKGVHLWLDRIDNTHCRRFIKMSEPVNAAVNGFADQISHFQKPGFQVSKVLLEMALHGQPFSNQNVRLDSLQFPCERDLKTWFWFRPVQ